jgi:Type ISP C-terminal specificity domain/N-6 DNA Methylase
MGGTEAPQWLRDAVSVFGEECRLKLSGPGDREAAIRSPLESLLRTAGQRIGVNAVFHDEVRDDERHVRPDYGVSINGLISGYVEVKAPGHPLDPARFRGHDKQQWERQRDLPNLIYTNGTHWRLYQEEELVVGPVTLSGGDLDTAGRRLSPPPELEAPLRSFLLWKPQPITTAGTLVKAVAPLTRLLRGEVLDQLAAEQSAVAVGADPFAQPFTGLAHDWREALFPLASDPDFADGYAQAVTFALLLARTEDIDVAGQSLHQVGAALGAGHSLMGRALQILTDDVAADFRVSLNLMVRVIGAVDWPRVRRGRRDTYLHLYERFLDQYDPELRRKSGSYYTPREVVEHMVRLTEQALVTRLGKRAGFRDPTVVTVDPAMGTGTFLHAILEHAARSAEKSDGPGAVPGAVGQVARRVVGFEIQMGPYAVAELRTADLLASYGAASPPGGMSLYVTDTLDDYHAAQTYISQALRIVAESRRKANQVKANADVTVVIGNPPYKELAVGDGGWVENGSREHADTARAILEDFYVQGGGRFKAKLKNLYIYFWRWATWKVWESTASKPDGDSGIVCFISTSGYLTGPAFTGMREYLRRYASEGWIIDLTPEGQTPRVPTRVFPGVRQPLAIGLFVRTPGTSNQDAAVIHHRTVSGRQQDKFDALADTGLDDNGWADVRTGWADPFTAAAAGNWDAFPSISDLMPWYSPGVFPTRTWVYAPSAETLRKRWRILMSERDPLAQSGMFKEGRDATMNKPKPPLPGVDTHNASSGALRHDTVTQPAPVRVGYRSFDRQWVLPDARLMDMPRRDVWAARIPGQVFTVEQHRKALVSGPGLVFSALIPDFDHFKGSEGGRTLPLFHPDGSPNLATGLAATLTRQLECGVTAREVLAYVAAIVAHPAYTRRFAMELRTPGIRVPITADPCQWQRAVGVGEEVIWLHTYGAAYEGARRPLANVRLEVGDPRQPLCTNAISAMPETIGYDMGRQVLLVGDGEFGPVPSEVWEYNVGGKNVIKSWFNYRKKEPGGKKLYLLDFVYPETWDPDWTTELVDLLTVLSRLTALEPAQADLLDRILSGPLLEMGDLEAAGILWPKTQQDRNPRHSYTGGGTLGIEGQLIFNE